MANYKMSHNAGASGRKGTIMKKIASILLIVGLILVAGGVEGDLRVTALGGVLVAIVGVLARIDEKGDNYER